MSYNIDWLKKEIHNGFLPDYLFFWGHTQKQENITDKSCLSQWFIAPFTIEGILYQTAEHYMMAQKARLFKDDDALAKILATPKPGAAKKIGREVKNFNDAIWKQQAFEFVVEGNYHKFSQHQSLKQFLLITGNKVIVEASPFDKIWGIGMAQSNAGASDPNLWKGANLLGFALMEVRTRLK